MKIPFAFPLGPHLDSLTLQDAKSCSLAGSSCSGPNKWKVVGQEEGKWGVRSVKILQREGPDHLHRGLK